MKSAGKIESGMHQNIPAINRVFTINLQSAYYYRYYYAYYYPMQMVVGDEISS